MTEPLDQDEFVHEMEKFVYWLAQKNTGQITMMETDEIVGELMLEMAKGLQHYANLPMEQLKAVIRKMMDNRIAELRHREYGTHRALGIGALCLDYDPHDESKIDMMMTHVDIPDPASVEELCESMERVELVRKHLSPIAQQVFDAVIFGNDRLNSVVSMSAIRHHTRFSRGSLKLKPWHVADALFMDLRDVKKAFAEISEQYSLVCIEA